MMARDVHARRRESGWRKPQLRFVARDSGFSMVEALVSVAVLMVIALSLVHMMITGLGALRTTKTVQQATRVGEEIIEAARSAGYDQLSMLDADLDPVADTQILTSCGSMGAGKFFDPDGAGPLACEQLVSSAAGGAVTDHDRQTTVGAETYRVTQYVTWVDAATQGGTRQDLKRVVAIVNWDFGSQVQTYRTSTLVAGNNRGVPLVKFEVTPPDQSVAAKTGEQVVFSHTIKNLGLSDSFDLTLPNPTGYTWTKAFYKDVNNNDIYDAGVDTQLTDTNANGKIDTGVLATDQSIDILEVWTIGATNPAGTPTLTLTVTSYNDTTVSQTATLNLTITTTPPQLKLYLHNFPSPPTGPTTATKALPMDEDAPTGTTLYDYATNSFADLGRTMGDTVDDPTQTNPLLMTNWVWQSPTAITIQGTMTLRIYMKIYPEPGKPGAPKCQADWMIYLRKKSSATTDTGSLILSDTKPKDNDCTAEWETETFTIPRTNINANEWLELKILLDKTKSYGTFYYDTVTYDSYLLIPQVVIRA